MFENGDLSTKINPEKQDHMESTRKLDKVIVLTMLMFKIS